MSIRHRLQGSSATPESQSAKSGLAQGQNGLSGELNKSVLPAFFRGGRIKVRVPFLPARPLSPRSNAVSTKQKLPPI